MKLTTPHHPTSAHGSRIHRLAAITITAVVLGSCAAACTGSSSGSSNTGSTSSTTTPAGSTGSAAGSPATSGAGSTVSPTSTGPAAKAHTATGTGSGSGNSTGSNAVAAACTGSELKVTLGHSGAAMGHGGEPLIFTNAGSRPCTLQGYPGAAIMKGATVVLDSTRTLNGYIGDERQLSSAPRVTLAPGGTASAMLEWAADSGQPCVSGGTGTLKVTPPNTTTTTSFGPMTAGSAGVCSGFEIHPVVAGTLNG